MGKNDTEHAEEIYANTDNINIHNFYRGTEDTTRNQTCQRTGSERVRKRCYRSVSVCLVLLCVLLLTAVIVLCVLINTNNHQFNNKTTNITEERDKLMAKNKNITKQIEQLNQEKNELRTCFNDGWIYYKFSLYFISSEKKNWTESRRYCRERGADLIIINNKEEQDFIKNHSVKGGHWIGLSDSDEEGRWKWVDGSTLNSSFWRSGEPNSNEGDEDCVVFGSTGWGDYLCARTFKWICERKILK
ncbi:CD209 antigen-like protein C [Paramisgurnus dabryanus]|uniref:CD209 antigen-like protein C n=1 Tax=Paramisgurnus dabryanus TaxID=90735 RepID=UPI003CCF46C0